MSLADAAASHFETLTQRTFYVVDTEYTNAPDGNHIVSIGIVPVVRGKRAPAADELYIEMNPGVPITAETSAIHGFTDAAVGKKRQFAFHAARILAKLNDPAGVFVCHTGVDVHVLRAELERLDERKTAGAPNIAVGLADLPDLPILDTSALPRQLRVPEVGNRTTIGLTRLADIYGLTNADPHHASSDARLTAAVLVKLLRAAATALRHDTLEDLLDEHARGTLRDPKVAIVTHRRGPSEPRVPTEHLALHTRPLLDPATPAEVDAWMAMAAECVQLRCRYLAGAAEVAGRENGHLLFDKVVTLLPTATEPGQAGTVLGALTRLIRSRGDKPALAHTRAVRWMTKNQPAITASTPCGESGSLACPDCRDHAGCPRDTIYQPVAEVATLGAAGELSEDRIGSVLLGRTQERGDRAIKKWSHTKVKAYMTWLVVDWERANGVRQVLIDRHLGWAMDYELHLVEPRLTLLLCHQYAARNQAEEAIALATSVLAARTSDTAYDELAEWQEWAVAALEQQARRARPRIIRAPRLARPDGRTNPNPYLTDR